MTTKAKNKVNRRPIGKKPTAGTRRGARRIPGPKATRPSYTGVRGERRYPQPGQPEEPLLDEGGMGE